ncbi:aminodeoxychorismate lyase [Thiohalobacter sp. IOR34]|uniref:aminodeoxychorismate lyase n=1 Tax=Thiohalobacter sp. IOR34 TaxID=3057176 RepID=UPI0025AFA31B|nr:aminodeoxychorismate lyase [Thiohalobacter sp. IOR34]WJW74251.1 aminodeoxychorismate lyase [Thiohalobacter sp. IOR34]
MSESLACLVNGIECRKLPLADRGLHYGDGLFETLAVRNGRIELFDAHLDRLTEGCRRLGLPLPDRSLLAAEAGRLSAGRAAAVLKIILTRGSGGRGYRPPSTVAATRILCLLSWPERDAALWRQGVRLRRCRTRLGLNPALAGIKHLNRLEQVLARSEWDNDDFEEGLMLDVEGRVVEGISSNVFFVTGGELVTPAIDTCGVAGVMRATLIELARERGIACQERPVADSELAGFEGALVSNSLIGLWPVRSIDDRNYAVPPLAGELQAALFERLGRPLPAGEETT